MKFTFKTIKPTGRYKSFESDQHEIKLSGKVVGNIAGEHPHEIRLMVFKDDINSDGNPNCPWKWIALRAEFESIDDAKKFLNDRFAKISERWKLANLD